MINGTHMYRPANRSWRERLATLTRYWPEYLSIAPFFILFAIFFAFPIVWAFILSFQRWDGIGTPRWVGLDNYAFMLRDPETHQVLYNTLILLALILPFGIMLPVFLAVLLNLPLKLRGLFRVLVFVPSVTPVVLVAIVFRFIFSGDYSWLNSALGLVGLGPYPWLKEPGWAYVPLVTLTIWHGLGFGTLVALGGLQSIDPEIYEAARLDGARQDQIFWRITVPLLRPVLIFLLVTSSINVVTMFNQPYGIGGGAQGNPQGSTLTPLLQIYNTGIGGRIGDSAALSFLISAGLILMMLFQLRITRTRDE